MGVPGSPAQLWHLVAPSSPFMNALSCLITLSIIYRIVSPIILIIIFWFDFVKRGEIYWGWIKGIKRKKQLKTPSLKKIQPLEPHHCLEKI